jgi:hypothetical protein
MLSPDRFGILNLLPASKSTKISTERRLCQARPAHDAYNPVSENKQSIWMLSRVQELAFEASRRNIPN